MKNIQAVALIATKDKSRKNLLNIKFTGSEVVAIDGFILAKAPCDIPKSYRVAEPYQNLKSSQSVNEDGTIETSYGTIFPTKTSEEECNYPPYKKIIPSDKENKHLNISFSIENLEKLIKSAKKVGKASVEFDFDEDNLKPVRAKVGEVEYIIMPFRNN